jgi:hypothetical protein
MNRARQARYEEFRSKVRAEHPRQVSVHLEVRRSLEMHRSSGGVTVLTGPTGIGKTNLIERIRWESVKEYKALPALETDGQVPFLPVTAMPPQHDTFRFPSLFRSILDATDEVLRDAHGARPAALNMTSDGLQTAALNVLKNRRPLVFCIDEAQHITYAVKEMRLAQHLDLIKWLATESKRPLLLVGTYELLRFSRISGQLGRRVDHIAFSPYDWVDDQDRRDFFRCLRFFREKLPVRLGIDIEADAHQRFLYAGCVGSVGLLKEWLERTLYRCLEDDRASITLEDLKKARMAGGKLEKIAEENEHGLEELRLIEGDDRRLAQMLGMVEEKAPPKRPAGALRPGTRKLTRDPVQVQAAA